MTDPSHIEAHSTVMSDSKNAAFNVLGSSKLNTPDGKNPPVSSSSSATKAGTAVGQHDGEDYRKECKSAHDALENRLRDQERESKWTGKW